MGDYFQDENCIYFKDHTIQFITAEGKRDENFMVKIYLEREADLDQIRIYLSTVKDETISYTSNITPMVFANIQRAQKLHISYEEFSDELKSLLVNSKTTHIIIKLSDIDTRQELGFYTMTSVKEIKILCVPFKKTPLITLVQYFKQKADFYAKHCNLLDTQIKNSKVIQETVESEHKKAIEILQEQFNSENKFLKNAFDSYKSDLNRKLKAVNLENEQLKNKVCGLSEENKKYILELARKDGIVNELEQNIIELRNSLKHVTIKTQQQMVTIDKYDKIKKLFSSTLADLLKYQMCLKRVQNMNEFQKLENGRLREDIKSCVSYITSVCSDEKILEQIITDNKNIEQTIGQINKIIEK